MELHLWITFFIANLLTSLSPGPGAVAAVHAGLSQGSRGGWKLVLGLQLALLLQLSVVALGAGALLTQAPTAFRILRWAGAAYLIWLGILQWKASGNSMDANPAAEAPWPEAGLIRRGMLVNLSNPKAILFMVALVPQFIDTHRALPLQYAIIAATMCSIDALVMGTYASLAARLQPWLKAPRLSRWRNRIFGTAFIGFGLALLRMESPAQS